MRRLIALSALTAATLGLVAPLATAAPAPPRTGFEQSNGARWTGLDEEQRFLAAVDKASRHTTVSRIGSTVQGRPLNLVRIGPAHATSTVLFICSQHGDEPSGRDACLTKLRDLAFQRENPRVKYLFVPTANPDGRAADTRTNANGVDINRDHLLLVSPEAKALAAVIREHRPEVIHDLHEYGATPKFYDKDVLYLWSRNLNVADHLHDESVTLSKDYAKPHVEGAGHSTGEYGIWTDPVTGKPIRQVAGDGQERILRNTAGLKHAVGILLETKVDPKDAAEAADPALNQRRRVHSQLAAVAGTGKLVADRWAPIALATGKSRLGAVLGQGPVYFGGADNEPAKPEDTEKNPACGYKLTAEQFAAHREVLGLHGIFSVPVPGGRLVPRNQEAGRLIPLLLDARADYGLVKATTAPHCV
ncbi:M14 family metallopeptidase [Crossiella sp. CA198]|uniref:M14 family metallopeptidase n=1 Tax=Crossiella sp. CA198 TaxID=3455607 RepID=UPI003F8D82B5